ncbi:MAG: TIGR04295 family B12-binding domain-containing radical SAM protein [Rhizobiales bacterium]|nr:TIGR04295 family B12-binding domain-containing radical SAM protein [Hyphomicrobiales bacterium]MDQ3558274.1 TIGR04295 family B12-binding domain-containing radical SAM protein [Pseudomonadota bacterium]
MKVALVNPAWSFDGSIYFGCRHPHLPLEYGAAKLLLQAAGHQVEIIDGHLFGMSTGDVAAEVRSLRPDMTVVTTAPSYLFWRCAPPELRVPQETLQALDGIGGLKVAVGPHASSTPRAAVRKLAVDIAVMGECEEALVEIANGGSDLAGTAIRRNGETKVLGGPRATRFTDLPPLRWGDEWIRRHEHHHHRFDAPASGPGAEVEASRGCPYHCTFCAKENYRDKYRRRDLQPILAELDRLIAQGVEYVYFIDEIFLPNRPLLQALVGRGLKFGVQTRIDLWKPDMLRLLGEAGCVSIEAGVESLTPEGRDALDKKCKLSTDELAELLLFARRHVPFVQANLIEVPDDDDGMVQEWRSRLRAEGVWANDPVPLFPYPGSPDYRKLWGLPDDQAWERAVSHYLNEYVSFSDIQEARPLPLQALERQVAA